MNMIVAQETLELIRVAAYAVGIVLTVILFALFLGRVITLATGEWWI